jgi:hypothetical protein
MNVSWKTLRELQDINNGKCVRRCFHQLSTAGFYIIFIKSSLMNDESIVPCSEGKGGWAVNSLTA